MFLTRLRWGGDGAGDGAYADAGGDDSWIEERSVIEGTFEADLFEDSSADRCERPDLHEVGRCQRIDSAVPLCRGWQRKLVIVGAGSTRKLQFAHHVPRMARIVLSILYK